jgi:hypothetical protein
MQRRLELTALVIWLELVCFSQATSGQQFGSVKHVLYPELVYHGVIKAELFPFPQFQPSKVQTPLQRFSRWRSGI